MRLNVPLQFVLTVLVSFMCTEARAQQSSVVPTSDLYPAGFGIDYITINATDLRPLGTYASLELDAYGGGTPRNSGQNPAATLTFLASLDRVPDGAQIVRIQLFGGAPSESPIQAVIMQACFGGWQCATSESVSLSGGGVAHTDIVNYRIEKAIATGYFASVDFAVADTSYFEALRIYYKRTIAPAPEVATYVDVPTTDPFFRSIEALVEAGGTAGCGGDRFCPDAVVTRKQLAAIVASLLGLGH